MSVVRLRLFVLAVTLSMTIGEFIEVQQLAPADLRTRFGLLPSCDPSMTAVTPDPAANLVTVHEGVALGVPFIAVFYFHISWMIPTGTASGESSPPRCLPRPRGSLPRKVRAAVDDPCRRRRDQGQSPPALIHPPAM